MDQNRETHGSTLSFKPDSLIDLPAASQPLVLLQQQVLVLLNDPLERLCKILILVASRAQMFKDLVAVTHRREAWPLFWCQPTFLVKK